MHATREAQKVKTLPRLTPCSSALGSPRAGRASLGRVPTGQAGSGAFPYSIVPGGPYWPSVLAWGGVMHRASWLAFGTSLLMALKGAEPVLEEHKGSGHYVTMRKACARVPAFDTRTQLESGALRIRCQPSGAGPPCVLQDFFSLHGDVERQESPRVTYQSRSALEQCVRRKRDEDWPTVEPHFTRTPDTKTVADVIDIIGDSRVTIVGASISAHLHGAVHCALARAGKLSTHRWLWRHWGWATLAEDNKGACKWADVRGHPRFNDHPVEVTEPCMGKGAFDKMLATTDILCAPLPPGTASAWLPPLCSSACFAGYWRTTLATMASTVNWTATRGAWSTGSGTSARS